MNIIIIYDGDDPCQLCLGWKRVDDGDGVSWKYWAELPAQSAIAIQLGLVKPIECPRCHGTGQEPKEQETSMDLLTGSEALYGFMAWLTRRDQAITIGAQHNAAPAVELVAEFCRANQLSGDCLRKE